MTLLLSNGKPVFNLIALARRHGIDAPDQISAQQLSNSMQKRWLRKTEHQYQVQGGPPNDENIELLTQLGFIDEVTAPADTYTGALLLGATIVAVRKRLAHLIKEDSRSACTSNTYLLGGARPLDPVKKAPEFF